MSINSTPSASCRILEYSLNNFEGSQFDVITDTQCLSHIGDESIRRDLINRLYVLCKSDVKISYVAALSSVDDAESFVNTFHLCGFELFEIKPLYFEHFGNPTAFSQCIFHKTSKGQSSIDRACLDDLWGQMLAKLNQF